jgi:hypothetical protein
MDGYTTGLGRYKALWSTPIPGAKNLMGCG